MIISIIVAMDEQGVIGLDDGLPWRLSADLKYVKATTMGKPIIMGRKTHETIGKPLPGRENIIITRNAGYRSEGCTVLHSMDAAFRHCIDAAEIVIMGGAEIYRQSLEYVSRIYLTEVHARVTGDSYFPGFNREDWQEVSRQNFSADARNEYAYSFVVLERKEPGVRSCIAT